MSDAYIYILKHDSGTTVKVGETTVSPQSRLQNYAKVYQLRGFTHHKNYRVPSDARRDVERRAHQILQKFQLSGIGGAREIFSCSVEVAESAIEKAIERSEAVAKAREQQKIAYQEAEIKKELRKSAEEKFRKSVEFEEYEILKDQILELNSEKEKLKGDAYATNFTFISVFGLGLMIFCVTMAFGIILEGSPVSIPSPIVLVALGLVAAMGYGFISMATDGETRFVLNKKGYVRHVRMKIKSVDEKIRDLESKSSTLRRDSGKRTYSVIAKRIISRLVLKYLNGSGLVIR